MNLRGLNRVLRDVRGIHHELYDGNHRDLHVTLSDVHELRRGVHDYRGHVHVHGLVRKAGSEFSNKRSR